MNQNQGLEGDADEVPQRQTAHQPERAGQRFLGFAMDDLAGLTVDEIVGDKPAVTMLLHYYKQLTDENTALKNERNTLATYVEGFKQKRVDAQVAAALGFLSSVLVGAGINLLTTDLHASVGYIVLIPGVIAQGFALYFSLRGGGHE